MGWIKRAWRSRGYGVHSPFAFRFITQVVGEELPYYDYLRLPDADAALLYRLAAQLQPSRIHQVGNGCAAAMAAMGCPTKKRVPPTWTGMPEMELAVATEAVSAKSILKHLSQGHACAILGGYNPETARSVEEFLDQLGYGMVFWDERSRGIVMPFRHLPRQTFPINLRG